MKPKVIIHNAVSVDGRITGFPVDMGRYYGLVSAWDEDATLVGSETMLAAEGYATDDSAGDADTMEAGAVEDHAAGNEINEEGAPEQSASDSNDIRSLLVIVDSRGRIRSWDYLRKQPYWRDAMALCSRATPREYLDYLSERSVEHLVVGEDHVDLRMALEKLGTGYGIKTIRVDSGGVLNGALLRAGLVDEVSLLVHPSLVGGTSPSSIFRAPDSRSENDVMPLELMHVERLDGDLVWLRYEVSS